MPLNVQCKRCANLRNDWCDKKHDSPDPDLIRDCQYYRTKIRADQIRAMTDEELAEFMASQVVAMADAIFGIAERVLMEKRGYQISFTDNFRPDLVEIKREYLAMLRQEVEE